MLPHTLFRKLKLMLFRFEEEERKEEKSLIESAYNSSIVWIFIHKRINLVYEASIPQGCTVKVNSFYLLYDAGKC